MPGKRDLFCTIYFFMIIYECFMIVYEKGHQIIRTVGAYGTNAYPNSI